MHGKPDRDKGAKITGKPKESFKDIRIPGPGYYNVVHISSKPQTAVICQEKREKIFGDPTQDISFLSVECSSRIGEHSKRKRRGISFTLETRDAFDLNSAKKRDVPGPGYYRYADAAITPKSSSYLISIKGSPVNAMKVVANDVPFVDPISSFVTKSRFQKFSHEKRFTYMTVRTLCKKYNTPQTIIQRNIISLKSQTRESKAKDSARNFRELNKKIIIVKATKEKLEDEDIRKKREKIQDQDRRKLIQKERGSLLKLIYTWGILGGFNGWMSKLSRVYYEKKT